MTHVTLFIYAIVFLITKGFINGSWRLRMVGLGYAPWPKNEINSHMYCRKNLKQQKEDKYKRSTLAHECRWVLGSPRSLRTPSVWVTQSWCTHAQYSERQKLKARNKCYLRQKKLSAGSFLDEYRISIIWTPILDRTPHETEHS